MFQLRWNSDLTSRAGVFTASSEELVVSKFLDYAKKCPQMVGSDSKWVMVEEATEWELSREDTDTPREMRVVIEAQPARQVDELDEDGNPTGNTVVIPAIDEVQKEFMFVKSDWRYEIEDLSANVDFQREQVTQKRLAEYPSQLDIIEAMLDGGLDDLQAERIAIKEKYPYPDAVRSSKVDIGWRKFRDARDKALAASDFSQLADAPFDSTTKAEYRQYRQYLRNLPSQHNNSSVWDAKVMSFSEWKATQV